METIEKLFDNYKGLVIFYIIVAVLALMLTKKIEAINSQANTEVIKVTYCA